MQQTLKDSLSQIAAIKEDIKNAINNFPGNNEPVGDDFSTYAEAVTKIGETRDASEQATYEEIRQKLEQILHG